MRRGFTLMEVVIVLGITAFLSALLLTYNRSSDSLIVLSVERAKVVGFLNRAKAFALERNLAKGGENVCAFGVNFDKSRGTMKLFRAAPSAGTNCANGFGTALGNTGTATIETEELDKRVEFQSFTCDVSPCVTSYDVVFVPPYLETVNPGSVVLGIVGRLGDTAAIEVGAGGTIAPTAP
ncbi:MAG: type II secretion system protein [Candidatus Jorgensenbacteria bacterium]